MESANREQHVGVIVMSVNTSSKRWQKLFRSRDRQFGQVETSRDGAELLGEFNQTTDREGDHEFYWCHRYTSHIGLTFLYSTSCNTYYSQ